MCTIVAALGQHPAFPLLLAANRDEFYDRPFSSPVLLDRAAGVAGGRDLRKGGSWLGFTARGFFVGLTNQRAYGAAAARAGVDTQSLRSRGEAVLEALRAGSSAGVARWLRALDPRDFPSFNLLWGDAGELHVAYVRHEGVEQHALAPGVYALANDRLGALEFPKGPRAEQRVRAALASAGPAAPWGALRGALEGLVGDHNLEAAALLPPRDAGARGAYGDDGPPEPVRRALQALCVHTPVYGTVASTVAALEPGRVAHYRFAHGPPCTSAFDDYAYLLR